MYRRAFVTGFLSSAVAWLGIRTHPLAQGSRRIQIRGAYGSPKTFWE